MRKRLEIDIYRNNIGPLLVFMLCLDETEIPTAKDAINEVINELMGICGKGEPLKVNIAIKYCESSEYESLFAINIFDDKRLSNVKQCFMSNKSLEKFGIRQQQKKYNKLIP